MIEHPVPQNVTAYQFRLVGDMTLKQFLEFGAGVILAWFIWTLQLPVFIRWPFILLSALAGFALAFMPLEERPLDQWVLAFFKAVYLPTLFNWKKSRRSDFLDFTPRKITDSKPLDTVVKAPAAGLTTLLEAYNLQSRLDQKPDELEKDWLDRQNLIPSLFEEVKVPAKLAAETTFPKKLPLPPTRYQVPGTSYHLHPLLPPDNPAAIIEIRDPSGLPVRAIKTNGLGQFTIATPLSPGIYELEIEKPGLAFDILKLEVKNQIIAPIEIRAKK